jgi:AmmeMemoRadiSam system protein A
MNHLPAGRSDPAASNAEPLSAEYSEAERRWLLRLAHASVREAVTREPQRIGTASAQPSDLLSHLREERGAFVTLHKHGKLRGCIGRVAAIAPLDETVREMAMAAALQDPRFAPVEPAELELLALEISVLSPMREVGPHEVVVGRDGMMISHNGRRGLLLPQVAVHWRWSREMFLAQTCMKAGLPPDQWMRGAKIETFTAEVFAEQEPCESLRE